MRFDPYLFFYAGRVLWTRCFDLQSSASEWSSSLTHCATPPHWLTLSLFAYLTSNVQSQFFRLRYVCTVSITGRCRPAHHTERGRAFLYVYCLAFLAFSSPLIRTMYVCVYFWAVPPTSWSRMVTVGHALCVFFRSLREIKCHRLMKSTEIFIFPLFSFFFLFFFFFFFLFFFFF